MPGKNDISWNNHSSEGDQRYEDDDVDDSRSPFDNLPGPVGAAVQFQSYGEDNIAATYTYNNSSVAAEVGYDYSDARTVPHYGANGNGCGPGSQRHLQICPQHSAGHADREVPASAPVDQGGPTWANHPTFNVEIFNDHLRTLQPVRAANNDGMDFSPSTAAALESASAFAYESNTDQGAMLFGQASVGLGYSGNPLYPARLDFDDAGIGEEDWSLNTPGSQGRSSFLSRLSLTMERTYPGHMYMAEDNLAQRFDVPSLVSPLSSQTSDYATTSPFRNTLTPATSQDSHLKRDASTESLRQTVMANDPYVPQAQQEYFASASGWEPEISVDTTNALSRFVCPLSLCPCTNQCVGHRARGSQSPKEQPRRHPQRLVLHHHMCKKCSAA